MDRRSLALAGCIGLAGLLGCGTETIPRKAVAGTTIAIPIPKTYTTGFGRAISAPMSRTAYTTTLLPWPAYDPESGLEDEARGEFVFSLYGGGSGAFFSYLPVRHVARVRVDENSRAAVDVEAGFEAGQAVAFVDLPSNVPLGGYNIKVEHYRRSAASPDDFIREQPQLQGGDWIGWGQRGFWGPENHPDVGISISIVPGTAARHNDFMGWVQSGQTLASQDQTASAQLIVPDPALFVYLYDPLAETPPAAISFVLEYRRNIVDMVGVQLARAQQSSALAFWKPDTTSADCDDDAVFGAIPITVVDPEMKTGAVEVAYRLLGFEDPDPGDGIPACGRFEPNPSDPDVRIQSGSVHAYDANGAEITPTTVSVPLLAY